MMRRRNFLVFNQWYALNHLSRIVSRSFATILLTCFVSWSAFAQITIVIDKVPANTPQNDTLHIVGSFNEWKPDDKIYQLQKQKDGTYTITLPKHFNNFQYKITRGSWQSVEGDINGKKSSDRIFTATTVGPHTHRIQILSWEDISAQNSWNIVVREIPSNTPYKAPLFVSGSFNNWNDNDEQYQLSPMNDGTFVIRIPKTGSDTIWYKFHRGNWKSVESRENGRPQYNRVAVWDKASAVTTIDCDITAWEDLGGGSSMLFSFILVATALQALILIPALYAMRNRNVSVTNPLICLLLITALSLTGRLATYNRTVFDWAPQLLLLADVAYFLYAPAFYVLITRMTGVSSKWRYVRWIFAAALIIQFVSYFKLMIMPRYDFTLGNFDGHFSSLFNNMAVAASLYNCGVLILCFMLINGKDDTSRNVRYLPSFAYVVVLMTYAAAILFLWIASHLVLKLGLLLSYDGRIAHEYTVDAVWMIFALSTFMHTFLLIRRPDLFQNRATEEKQKVSSQQKENIETYKAALTYVMKKQKPYLNPKLALQDLADKINTNIHTLSWIINEGYDKNFFDYVNEHRIEEFKRLATSDQYRNYTFLAIAMEVGFSSKTTFNRAFKKITGKTPREYFSNVQESQLEGIND